MGTRNVLRALLLTVGVAVASTGGQAQEVPPADPVIPLPLGHDRMSKGGFYFAGEFIYMKMTNPIKDQTIAVRGLMDSDGSVSADLNGTSLPLTSGPPIIAPGVSLPGTFFGSGEQALNANQVNGPGMWTPAFKVTAGWKFQDGVAIEASFMNMAETKYSATATLVPPTSFGQGQIQNPGQLLQNTFLFSPVYNFPNEFAGAIQKIALGNPYGVYGIWNGASVESLSFVQRLTQYDITARIPVWDGQYCRCYGLVGPRYVKIWERFNWRTVDLNFDGTTGQDVAAQFYNVTSNNLWGADVGVGSEWYLAKGFSFSLDGRVAGFMDFAKLEDAYMRQDFAIGHKRVQRAFAFVPEFEAQANLWWYPIEGMVCRLGFNSMNFVNTYSSPEPVSFNYSSLDPQWKSTFRYVIGWNMGVGFIF